MYPVIVIGTMRSGTSVVARMLQENLDLFMSSEVRRDLLSPKGYYEDPELIWINKARIAKVQNGSLAWNGDDPVWDKAFSAYAKKRKKKKQWGFKDPRIVPFLPWVWGHFANPTLIVCKREKSDILNSMVKKMGMSLLDASKALEQTQELLTKYLKGKSCHWVDLTKRRAETDLTNELRGILKGS